MRGLILDLRNNTRGSMEQAVRTASIFLGDQEIVSAKGRTPASEEKFRGKQRDLLLKTPLPTVVLVDHGTARAAEIVAAALRDQYQATLLGTKTLGLCGLTKAIPLQDGSALVMTVVQCYAPSGQKIQGKGLEPKIQGQKPKDEELAGGQGAPEADAGSGSLGAAGGGSVRREKERDRPEGCRMIVLGLKRGLPLCLNSIGSQGKS